MFVFCFHAHFVGIGVFFHHKVHKECLDVPLFVMLAAMEFPFHFHETGPLSIFAILDYVLFKMFFFCLL